MTKKSDYNESDSKSVPEARTKNNHKFFCGYIAGDSECKTCPMPAKCPNGRYE